MAVLSHHEPKEAAMKNETETLKDCESTLDMTLNRRDLFRLAGVAGLALMTSGVSLSTPELAFAASSSSYKNKVKKFLSNRRWKDGASWGSSQKPKSSKQKCTGCAAYCADFAKEVCGLSSYNKGEKFTKASKIRSGDVIHVTGSSHWIVVLSRKDKTSKKAKLKTAEGNWGGKVVVSSSAYTIENGVLKRRGKKFRTFEKGYHCR